jgi:ABC-type nitrate/sulfonate/bicarbonate transport system ATPase subunit
MIHEIDEVLLSVNQLGFRYNKDGPEILSSISFNVLNQRDDSGQTKGEILGIVGPSGSGKSTLFSILGGFNLPTSGSVLLNNKPIIVGDVGIVTQNYTIFGHRTLEENLRIAMRLNPLSNEQFVEYVRYFDLEQHLTKYPSELSGGQRQRGYILMQIFVGHKCLLLDEPFSGQDPKRKEKTLSILRKVADIDDKNTLVVVTHDIQSACAICDKIVVLGKQEGLEGTTIVKEMSLLNHPNPLSVVDSILEVI